MNTDDELKMWLVVRKDLEISKGKLAGQSGHAYEGLTSLIYETGGALLDTYNTYKFHNTPKITVTCKNLHALDRAETECNHSGVACYKVTDEGRTEFGGVPTVTVLAFGPAYRKNLPKFLQDLQFMKDEDEDGKKDS